MAASINMPPRHDAAHWEALASEPLSLAERFGLFGIILLASIPYIYVGAWAAEVLG